MEYKFKRILKTLAIILPFSTSFLFSQDFDHLSSMRAELKTQLDSINSDCVQNCDSIKNSLKAKISAIDAKRSGYAFSKSEMASLSVSSSTAQAGSSLRTAGVLFYVSIPILTLGGILLGKAPGVGIPLLAAGGITALIYPAFLIKAGNELQNGASEQP
jgi:hypothetical protein